MGGEPRARLQGRRGGRPGLTQVHERVEVYDAFLRDSHCRQHDERVSPACSDVAGEVVQHGLNGKIGRQLKEEGADLFHSKGAPAAKGAEHEASLRPEEAMRVAAKDIGQAFREDIGMANVLERMQAAPSRSGFRLFEVFEDGSFRDRWLTLDELTDTSVTALLQRPEPPER